MHKIFIDGREGTTGLQIQERLEGRRDIELCELPAALRKDPAARKALINQVDFVITCLPDDAARESVSLLENPRTRLIDPSRTRRRLPNHRSNSIRAEPKQRQARHVRGTPAGPAPRLDERASE